jgi:hypothetical protein
MGTLYPIRPLFNFHTSLLFLPHSSNSVLFVAVSYMLMLIVFSCIRFSHVGSFAMTSIYCVFTPVLVQWSQLSIILYIRITLLNTFSLHLHYCQCICITLDASALLSMHLHYSQCICITLDASALLSMHLHYSQCICITLNASALLSMHVHYSQCMCITLDASALLSMHVHYSQCMCITLNACALLSMHLHYSQCICITLNASALLSMHLHYSQCKSHVTFKNDQNKGVLPINPLGLPMLFCPPNSSTVFIKLTLMIITSPSVVSPPTPLTNN